MKVYEFMTKDVISLKFNQTVEDAAQLMLEKNISALPIVDSESNLVGIITESDFVGKKANIPHALASIKRLLGQNFYLDDIESLFAKAKKSSIEEVMTRHPKTVSPDFSLTDVVNMMIRLNLKRIPVVQDKKLVGIITRQDIMKAFIMVK
jgi:CBS domain-containing protein